MASNFPLSAAVPRKRPLPSVPLAIVGGLLLAGAGLFAYLQFAPHKPAAEVPLSPEARAYVGHLKLADVGMKGSKNYFSQMVVEIAGNITNAGDRNLDTVEINCVFQDAYGQMALRQRVPIVSAKMGGLKPGETKSFRLPFDQLPEAWNQKMPLLVIASVKFN
ncbi:MAG TPA: FxLYD domain-containing protein [Bryobacteraceae bacterium]